MLGGIIGWSVLQRGRWRNGFEGLEETEGHPPYSQAWWAWGVLRKVMFTYSLALVRTFREEAKGQESFCCCCCFLMTDREFQRPL